MKQKLLLLLCLLAMPFVNALGDEYTDAQGVIYTLNNDGNTYSVSGHTDDCTGNIIIPETVNGRSVTAIGMIAFYDCKDLLSVTIPDGVTSIGADAFYNCEKLSSINIPTSVTYIGPEAFMRCEDLESIIIPTSVTKIEPDVFRESGLTSINIPTSVTRISSDAFNDSWLYSVTIPNSVSSIGEKAFLGCNYLKDIFSHVLEPFAVDENVFPTNGGSTILHVPAGTKSVYLSTSGWSKFGDSKIVEFGSGAEFTTEIDGIQMTFAIIDDDNNSTVQVGCWDDEKEKAAVDPTAVDGKSIVIPEQVTYGNKQYTVTRIGAYAFKGCQGLVSVSIPNTVTNIEYGAFQGCSSLTTINIPEGVTAIEYRVFCYCDALTTIEIPEGVTSIGGEAFRGCSELASITIPNSVTSIGYEAFRGCNSLTSITIPDGVASIANRTFSGCRELASITIPNSVTSIGYEAFSGCSELASITIPNSVTSIGYEAFRDCNSLTSITIPDGVTAIEYRAFRGCSELASITIPNSVTSVGNDAFRDCNSLTSITIPDGVTSIGGETFRGCSELASITIPNSVTSVGNDAFRDCIGLSYVYCYAENVPTTDATAFDGSNIGNATLFVPEGSISAYQAAEPWSGFNRKLAIGTETPDQEYTDDQGVKYTLNEDRNTYSVSGHTDACSGDIVILETVNGLKVTSIGYFPFLDCSGLTSITIPTSVTSIGEEAFMRCSGLTSVNIPNSVTYIGSGAFSGCSNLASITIPNSVTEIGDGILACCSRVISIQVESGNSVYDSRGDCHAIIETQSNKLIAGCVNTIIPDGVTSIGKSVFSGFSELTSIVIPNSVTSIGDGAFASTGLTSVSIPDGVTTLGFSAFRDCSSLTSIVIPNSVTSIGEYAFEGCSNLTSITIPNSVTFIDFGAFASTGLTSITIPGSVQNIPADAFSGSSLTSVTINEGVKSIGAGAFRSCEKLSKVILPSTITSIGEDAFVIYSAIPNPDSGGPNIVSHITEPFAITENVFGITDNWLYPSTDPSPATLYVPVGTKSKYESLSGWNKFATIEEGEFDETSIDGLYYRYNTSLSTATLVHDDTYCSNFTSVEIPATINVDGVIYDVTTIGYKAFYHCNYLTSIKIPKSVTSIGQEAISECLGLSFIEVEDGNTKYDSRDNCNALIETGTNTLIAGCKNTIIPNIVTSIGNYAFCGSGLTSLTIPNSVTSIGESSFNSCYDLTSITIPSSVTSIGKDAFKNCSFLKEVYCYAENVTTTDATVFQNSNIGNAVLFVPEGSIAAYQAVEPWSGFGSIKAIGTETPDQEYTDGQGVKYTFDVGKWEYTVSGHTDACTGFITIPATVNGCSVTAIGEDAFWNCNGLISITIPSSVTSIGYQAFLNCHSLTSIAIPNSVTSIGFGVFNNCIGLTSIIVEDGNTVYDSRDNCNAIIETASNTLIAGCQNTAIPNSVTSIARYAFWGCLGLTSITIPAGVTSIGDGAFLACNGLTSITIPSSVTSIGGSAFEGCTGLTSIIVEEGNAVYDSHENCNAIIETASNTLIAGCQNTTIPGNVTSIGYRAFQRHGLTSIIIPSKVTSIGSGAFSGCSDLTAVTCYAENAPTTYYDTFMGSNIGNATLFVPEGSIEAYQAAESWSGFKRILAIGTEIPDQEYTDDQGVKYTLNDDGNTYTVSGHTEACSGDVTIPETVNGFSVTAIGYEAFSDCSGLTSLTIPASVTCININDVTFRGCGSLASIVVAQGNSVYDSRENCNAIIETTSNTLMAGCKNTTIPSSVTSIGRYAFCSSGLTSLTIPNGVTSIGHGAFRECSSLASIFIPSSVTSIGDDDTWAGEIFHSCSVLNSIIVEDGNPVFDSRDNCNAIIKTATNTLMAGCKNTTIPSTVTSIADEAFFCSYGLTSVMIPASVTSIGARAFDGCFDLSAVKIGSSTPIDILLDTFEDNANAILYVPKGSKASYSSATGWQDFSAIKEYPDGDVNQDGEIDVIDVVDIARFVVGTPSTAFEEFLADLDGSGAVNVADAIVLVNDIAGDTNFARSRAASSPNLSDNVLSLTGDGSALSLQMDGDGRFAAFQFDLWLPSDMDVMKLSLNDMRRQGHQLLYNKVSDSHYRVVALSTSGNAFNGVSGELLGITLDDFASDEVYLDNIHFVTTEGIDVPFDSVRWGYATSILRPEASSRDDQPVYNLNGQRLDSPRKGVNIIGGKKVVIK